MKETRRRWLIAAVVVGATVAGFIVFVSTFQAVKLRKDAQFTLAAALKGCRNQYGDVTPTALDLRITAKTNVLLAGALNLPIRVENRSTNSITATVAHEWHGGLWPPTDLIAAAVRPDGLRGSCRAMQVYLTGEEGSMTKPTVWHPGEYHDFLLRMDRPGTGSCHADPLIDAKEPGKYFIGVAMVFKIGDHSECYASHAMDVTVAETKKAKE